MLISIDYGKVPEEFAHYFNELSKKDAMINYNDQNEAVKGCIDELAFQYAEDMRQLPFSWVECAYNRAMMVMLDEIEKKVDENEPE